MRTHPPRGRAAAAAATTATTRLAAPTPPCLCARQHVASRVASLPEYVQRANDYRAITGEGLTCI